MERSPWIDDDAALLQEQVARFIARELVPHAERWEKDRRVGRESWKRAGEGGLLCISIPDCYGGGGGTWGHEAVIAQELVRAGLGGGLGVGINVSSGIVAHYLLAYASEAQKKHWLPLMSSGDVIGAIAMSEPGAGSDLQSIKTSARRDGDDYIINGQKTFITNGQNADIVIVAAKTDPTKGAKGISLFLVEVEKAEGFERGRNLHKVGMHAQDTSELFFSDMRVPAESLLGGEEGRGFYQLMEQLSWERLSLAINAVSMMERAVEITTDYVKERRAFGKALIDFQNTQFKLVECKAAATIARAYVDKLILKMIECNAIDPAEGAMAKYWTTEALGKVVDECVQLHGGYGYMEEYPIARMWADARVTRIYGGANEIMKSIIARSFVKG